MSSKNTITTSPLPLPWTVYLIQTDSGLLYTGITTNMARRLQEHQGTKKGARFFHFSEAKELLFCEPCENRSLASKREAAIKKMTRSQKLALIAEHAAECKKIGVIEHG